MLIFFQVPSRLTKYQIYMKSPNGPIDVVLLNNSSGTSSPVALTFPPPEDVLRRAHLAMLAAEFKEEEARRRRTHPEEMQQSSLSNAETDKPCASACEHFTFQDFKNVLLQ